MGWIDWIFKVDDLWGDACCNIQNHMHIYIWGYAWSNLISDRFVRFICWTLNPNHSIEPLLFVVWKRYNGYPIVFVVSQEWIGWIHRQEQIVLSG